MNDIKETLGRLYLWKIALERVFQLLEFRRKIERFNKTGRPRYIRDLYDKERGRLNNWLELEGEELNNFEEKNVSLFPDILDIALIEELITEEIIIKLCTIFNTGNGKLGVVAENSRTFRSPIMKEILSQAFSVEVKDKFENFIHAAKAYRDGQAAHFDELSFNVIHGDKKPNEDGFISGVGWSNASLMFDWDFIGETIPLFKNSLRIYIEKLQKEVF